MNPIVVKFGGSSLATAPVSLKRSRPSSVKIPAAATSSPPRPASAFPAIRRSRTCSTAAMTPPAPGQDFAPVLDEIRQRFADIISELQLQVDLAPDFAAIEAHLRTSPQRDYMASRGEYLNSRLLAAYLGFAFVDAAQMVLFRARRLL